MTERKERVVMANVRYVEIDETTWPVPSGTEWVQRYGTPNDLADQRLGVASVIAAYTYLTNPDLPQKDAVAALRRARHAAAKVRADA